MSTYSYANGLLSLSAGGTSVTALSDGTDSLDINPDGSLPVKPSLDVVDQIDTTPLLDISSSNIPASASAPLTIVASLAADVKKIIIVEDIGEYIGLYSDPAGSPVLECILPLGGGEIEIELASGTVLGLRHMKNSAISSAVFMAINFLG